MGIRTFAIAAIVLWAAHRGLGWYLPVVMPWGRIVALVLILAGSWSFGLISIALTARRGHKPPTYGILSEGVLVPSKEHPVIAWANIVSYTVSQNPRVPQVRTLFLHRIFGNAWQFPLPGGELEKQILAELAERLPQRWPPPWASPLKTLDWLIALVLTAGFVAAASVYLGRHGPNAHGSPSDVAIIIGIMLAGPGT
jgi:hypothetical protein